MPARREFPAIGKILAYAVVAFAAGAMVAPPVFWLGQTMEAGGLSDWLAKFPFHRVLSRCLQVSALVLLVPALRWVGLRRPADLGLRRNTLALTDLGAGIVLATSLVAVAAVAGLLVGWSDWREGEDFSALGRIALTAAVVSCVEEAVFRGVVLGVCLWSLPRAGAIGLTSLLFAVVHFLKPAKTSLAAGDVRWWSGFTEAFQFGAALPGSSLLFFGLASLLLAGWILGTAAVGTRSLWLPVGLHAGWVFSQQTSNLFLASTAPADTAGWLPWVGPNLVSGAVPTGLVPLAALFATGWLVRLYLRHVFRPAVSPLS